MLMGKGGSGVAGGDAPVEGSTDTYGVFHRGFNRFESITGTDYLKYKMDSPDSGKALELEAIGYDGDSGGPAFITVDGRLQIAGVNSHGDCDPPLKCPYGKRGWVAKPAHGLSATLTPTKLEKFQSAARMEAMVAMEVLAVLVVETQTEVLVAEIPTEVLAVEVAETPTAL